MGAQLYHQRYQDWRREPAGGIDAVAARSEEFTQTRLSLLGNKLLTEIENYLAFFALCSADM